MSSQYEITFFDHLESFSESAILSGNANLRPNFARLVDILYDLLNESISLEFARSKIGEVKISEKSMDIFDTFCEKHQIKTEAVNIIYFPDFVLKVVMPQLRKDNPKVNILSIWLAALDIGTEPRFMSSDYVKTKNDIVETIGRHSTFKPQLLKALTALIPKFRKAYDEFWKQSSIATE